MICTISRLFTLRYFDSHFNKLLLAVLVFASESIEPQAANCINLSLLLIRLHKTAQLSFASCQEVTAAW